MKESAPAANPTPDRTPPLSRVLPFFRTGFSEGTLILILLAFFAFLTVTWPNFLPLNNLSNLGCHEWPSSASWPSALQPGHHYTAVDLLVGFGGRV